MVQVKTPLRIQDVESILGKLISQARVGDVIGKRLALHDLAWMMLGFYCLLRKSELCALRI